jgi:uncharacterized protein (TIGR00369 family)
MPRMDIAQLDAFIAEHFPEANGHARITALSDHELNLCMPFQKDMLRPGGTIAGPALMALADLGAYYMVLAQFGPIALAVTSSLTIHFLRKPAPEDVLASVRMLKKGRQLAVCEVHMTSAGDPGLIAQATVTYSVPTQ